MLLFIRLVLDTRASLRCSGRVPGVVSEVFGLAVGQPDWTTGRLWLLRLGLFKLTRPKTYAEDWVWFIDHSVQAGSTRCLLILGIRLGKLPPAGEPLRHQDMEPIALLPVEQSTKEIVDQQLEDTVAVTGVPRAILDDHGSDLHGGVKLFRERHPETIEIYDITHKAARLLKRRLDRDSRWQAFCEQIAQTRRLVQQTELACVAPPAIGSKARFMNLAPVIRWGEQTLRIPVDPAAAELAHVPAERLQEKLGWLSDYAPALREWSQDLCVIETTLDFVRGEGLTRDSGRQLREMLDVLVLDPAARTLATELSAFVRDEASQALPNERLPGSTEVLESCFGKQKAIEQHHSRSGFTSLILTLGALVSETTEEVITEALTTVRTCDVWSWCKEHLGRSVQSLRKTVRDSIRFPETKPG